MHERAIETIEGLKTELRGGEMPSNRVQLDAAIQCLGDAQHHLKFDSAARQRESDDAKAKLDEARKLVAEAEQAKPAPTQPAPKAK